MIFGISVTRSINCYIIKLPKDKKKKKKKCGKGGCLRRLGRGGTEPSGRAPTHIPRAVNSFVIDYRLLCGTTREILSPARLLRRPQTNSHRSAALRLHYLRQIFPIQGQPSSLQYLLSARGGPLGPKSEHGLSQVRYWLKFISSRQLGLSHVQTWGPAG